MVLQHYSLNISLRTQLLSGVFYTGVILAILFAPWLGQDWPIWLILVVLLTLEAILSQKQINHTKGDLTISGLNRLAFWHGQKWLFNRTPFMLNFGILLSLKSETSGEIQRLWIAKDSLPKDEWRSLCYELQHNNK